ncbi:MAG: glycosyltransferase family 39 protein, partial [Bacteroidia bacterium]|nr:glycosyltransferase family 39 protein [Bacteroidia bacterium]
MKEKALNIIKFINTREWLSFLIVLIASVLFYSSQIIAAPLWYDELFSLFWSQLNSPDEVKSVSNWDVAPPGYNLLLHYWTSIFGIKELAVRGLSCLCTSLMVSLLYLLTKKLFGNISALFVLALCLTNTTVFFYANEA